jgi:hypothetical protein
MPTVAGTMKGNFQVGFAVGMAEKLFWLNHNFRLTVEHPGCSKQSKNSKLLTMGIT